MPEREELGDLDEADWQAGPDGKKRDPWQNSRYLYLTIPETAQILTFSTASWSGRGAVIGLGDQISRMRVARPGVSAVVELSSAPHKTKFGTGLKPIIRVVGWVGGGGGGADLKQIAGPRTGGQAGKPAPQVEIMDDMMDDGVPF
jgi:hypothetical protein